ncbi:hypothetical protein BU16DRAFT_564167 [Lophium mytilinum]|uniref:Uncharacterized protein n=1 Tax=Lophium mytilinum TaxID=390894 RepID=A0A6A6QK76_9PEZI|nr:hypothetical protein BU16DRAFT_564167 [Lophium mytilinum]
MQPTTFLLSILALLTTAWTTPVPEASIESNAVPQSLEARSDHQANFYSSQGCSAGYITTISDFGCGGTCHTFNQGVEAVYLQYGGAGDKPTADCFTSFDCSGSANTHNGIQKGYSSGCTNEHSIVHSCYLYDGC